MHYSEPYSVIKALTNISHVHSLGALLRAVFRQLPHEGLDAGTEENAIIYDDDLTTKNTPMETFKQHESDKLIVRTTSLISGKIRRK